MKKGLKILLTAEALINLSGGFFGPIYAIFVQQIGGNILDAGGAYSIYLLAAGILVFLISRWEDHIKHKENLVIAGYGLTCLGFIGYLFVQNPIHLFIVQAILGLALAVNAPAYDALYSKFLDKGKFASEWGLHETQYYLVTAIGALIGAFIADIYGFRRLFMTMAAVSFIGFLISLKLKK